MKDFEFVPVHKEFPIAGAKVTRNAPAQSAAICSVLFQPRNGPARELLAPGAIVSGLRRVSQEENGDLAGLIARLEFPHEGALHSSNLLNYRFDQGPVREVRKSNQSEAYYEDANWQCRSGCIDVGRLR
jgi:hypothetical protein